MFPSSEDCLDTGTAAGDIASKTITSASQGKSAGNRRISHEHINQWIGLRENLEETMVFTIK
jgi:hypothetical protein